MKQCEAKKVIKKSLFKFKTQSMNPMSPNDLKIKTWVMLDNGIQNIWLKLYFVTDTINCYFYDMNTGQYNNSSPKKMTALFVFFFRNLPWSSSHYQVLMYENVYKYIFHTKQSDASPNLS